MVDLAVMGEPSIITAGGERAAVVLSFEAWTRLADVPSFARLLMAAPIDEGDVPARDPTPLRDVEV